MSRVVTRALGRFVRGRETGRIRATWRILVPLLAAYLVLTLSGGAAVSLGVDRGTMMLISFGGTAIGVAGLAVLSVRYLDERPLTAYGYHVSADWWLDLGVGLGLGVVVVAVNLVVARATGSLQVTSPPAIDGWATAGWLLLFFVGFVCVGFYEEFLYRGLFVTNAIEGLSERGVSATTATVVALLASTGTFAAIHLPSALAQGASVALVAAKAGLLGGLLGVAYLLTDELALPTGLHLGVNYAQMNLFGIAAAGVEGIPTVLSVERTAGGLRDPAHGIPLFAATLLGYGLVILWVARRRDRLTLQRPITSTRADADR
jgi:hypothetical protein